MRRLYVGLLALAVMCFASVPDAQAQNCPYFTVNANFGGYEIYHDVQVRVIEQTGRDLVSIKLLASSNNVSMNTVNRISPSTIDFILHRKSSTNQAWMANLQFEVDPDCNGDHTFPWFIGYDH